VGAKNDHYLGMAGWPELREDLLHLEETRHEALTVYPDPRSAEHSMPYGIALSADAEDVAADLHAKYGGLVELRVGALAYPGRRVAGEVREFHPVGARPEVTDLRVELDGALSVRSGADARHDLLITNLVQTPVTILTSGYVATVVLDPSTGAVVGGSTKSSHLVVVQFTARPGDTIRAPLFVGTESFDPRLGYAVPPGQWAVIALLDLNDGGRATSTPKQVRSPLLPITII
jgi:hypothetical protein